MADTNGSRTELPMAQGVQETHGTTELGSSVNYTSCGKLLWLIDVVAGNNGDIQVFVQVLSITFVAVF